MENTDNTITEKITPKVENVGEPFTQYNKTEAEASISPEVDAIRNIPFENREGEKEGNANQNVEIEKSIPKLESVSAGYPMPKIDENDASHAIHKSGEVTADDAIAILKKKISSDPIDVD